MHDDFGGSTQWLASHVQFCNGPIKKPHSKSTKKKRVHDSKNINRSHQHQDIKISLLDEPAQIPSDDQFICFGNQQEYMEEGDTGDGIDDHPTDLKFCSGDNNFIFIDPNHARSNNIHSNVDIWFQTVPHRPKTGHLRSS
jgi:hypothetical protein